MVDIAESTNRGTQSKCFNNLTMVRNCEINMFMAPIQ